MSKVDVRALLEGSDLRMDGVAESDLERFASLVLEEAAKVCDQWDEIPAAAIRALKPVQP